MNVENNIKDLAYMTGVINTMARNKNFSLYFTAHAKEQMKARGISTLDVINVFKFGIVEKYFEKDQHKGEYKIHKYKITGDYDGRNRSVRQISLVILVEVDRFQDPAIKIKDIITVMWKD